MDAGGRLADCVLELDDMEVAMVTSGGEERRDGEAQKLLGREPARKERKGHNVFVLARFVCL